MGGSSKGARQAQRRTEDAHSRAPLRPGPPHSQPSMGLRGNPPRPSPARAEHGAHGTEVCSLTQEPKSQKVGHRCKCEGTVRECVKQHVQVRKCV